MPYPTDPWILLLSQGEGVKLFLVAFVVVLVVAEMVVPVVEVVEVALAGVDPLADLWASVVVSVVALGLAEVVEVALVDVVGEALAEVDPLVVLLASVAEEALAEEEDLLVFVVVWARCVLERKCRSSVVVRWTAQAGGHWCF